MSTLATKNISYAGGAFGAALPDGRSFGELSIIHNTLRFSDGEHTITLPLAGINIRTGGANNRSIFFTHPDIPDWTLHTGDHEILKDPSMTRNRNTAPQLAKIRNEKRRSHAVLITLFGMLVLGTVGIFQLKEPLVRSAARQIPIAWEKTLGDATIKDLKTSKQFITDPLITQQLEKITAPLLSALPQDRYQFSIHISSDEELNAFALPGGNVVFNQGMLLAVERSEEIVGVLAHEAAHVTLQHGMRQFIGTAGIFIIVQTLLGDASGLLAILANNSVFLLSRKFSRDYESEADEQGWQYLLDANIDPRGMVSFFEKLKAKQEELDLDLPSSVDTAIGFLSTHPATDERIATLQQKWTDLAQQSGFIQFKNDLEKLQALLRARATEEDDHDTSEVKEVKDLRGSVWVKNGISG